jgi:hypothetical protein
MTDDEDLWSDEINAFVDAAFDSGIVSRNPSDAEEHVAYRYAIKLAIDEGRRPQTDALKRARDALEGMARYSGMRESWQDDNPQYVTAVYEAIDVINAALEARGLEIREKGETK